jgi:hypothetical protein
MRNLSEFSLAVTAVVYWRKPQPTTDLFIYMVNEAHVSTAISQSMAQSSIRGPYLW